MPEYCTIGGQPVTTTIKPRGANGTAFHTPWPVEWILDIEVPPGRQVMITLITDQQYKALSAGRKPSGQPPLKDNLVNIDTASVRLPAGGYFWALNNTSNTPLTVSYRCSFIRK